MGKKTAPALSISSQSSSVIVLGKPATDCPVVKVLLLTPSGMDQLSGRSIRPFTPCTTPLP